VTLFAARLVDDDVSQEREELRRRVSQGRLADRKDPVLPLSPGRTERHGFKYFRHGTLSP